MHSVFPRAVCVSDVLHRDVIMTQIYDTDKKTNALQKCLFSDCNTS